MSLLKLLNQDIGIDLGTANTLVYVRGKGIVINEPSVVAVNKKTNKILAIGNEARNMVGRTPAHIVATRPLTKGVISDFEITEQMLRHFFDRVRNYARFPFSRPRVVIGIPSGVTEVEKRAVEDAAKNAGARQVYLIEEPMAAAIGARLPVQEAAGNMIVDIGGGTTEIAVISLGGIVAFRSLRIAGDKLNDDIIHFAQEEMKMVLGERTAEEIKIATGSAKELEDPIVAPMRGRDVLTGLPKEIMISDTHIRRALSRSVYTIVEAIKNTIEETPPELVADIMSKGIILAGGGSLLRNLDKLIAQETLMPVYVTEDPLTSVVRGTGIVLEDIDGLHEVLVSADSAAIPVY
ncbi:MAG: rod shape-determining protein [Candidatus Terrybacteria bacterium RIFCSPLOWO2_01_FULL_40_23]|uniref:Cell shape-determining protein MreB n=1 Tax=Candidatus Terrybacteria bacterium RIFCSPLOWO2_01_FULL_40_23 TaxID=1802366 RepID=A0A1G2PSV7_9BACT|nr:MAG: rod shape-determining protein [Candidatus Terrybacteria bacterium RIFCSPLOWO2_01_FULL_40_23]